MFCCIDIKLQASHVLLPQIELALSSSLKKVRVSRNSECCRSERTIESKKKAFDLSSNTRYQKNSKKNMLI